MTTITKKSYIKKLRAKALEHSYTVQGEMIDEIADELEAMDVVWVPQSALDWLAGSGPGPDGRWFDDDAREPKTKGNFWWRSEFRRKIAAAENTND